MSKAFMDAAQTIRTVLSRMKADVGDNDRRVLVATAFARALSLTLMLPSTAVDNVMSYFANSYDEQVCNLLSKLNEEFIIDVNLTRDLTFKFYKFRYDCCHDPMILNKQIAAFATHFTDYFPQNVCDVMKKETHEKNAEDGYYFDTWMNVVRTLTQAITQSNEEDTNGLKSLAVL